MSLRTPLGRARGLGAAGEGVSHWWHQRLTAVALVPLVLWLVYFVVKLATFGPDAINAWLKNPLNAILMAAFVGTSLYHSHLGLRVIVEDYLHVQFLKVTTLALLAFAHVFLAITGFYAILKMSLVAGV